MLKDLSYSLRSLLKRPAFSAIVIATLALGIGANAAVFSVINAVLLRPLPYRDVDQVVTIWQTNVNSGATRDDVSPGNFVAFSEQSQSFDAIAGIEPFGFSLLGEGEPERFSAWRVTSGFFRAAGTDALLGRTFNDGDYKIGNEKVVVVSHRLWQRRFGSDPTLVGRKVTLNDQPYIVVGIMPPQFNLPADRDIWAPRTIGDQQRQAYAAKYWNVIGRLKPGVTLTQAQQEMNGIASRLATEYPESNGGMGTAVVPLFEQMTGQFRSALWMLGAAVCFVLLIACANVANLLLVRGAERQKEFAIRLALGAERFQLLRQTLMESLILALTGGALGILLAWWGISLLPALNSSKIPRLEHVSMDLRVLLFTLGVSLATAFIFGLVPATQFWRNNLQGKLKEGGRSGSAGPMRQTARKTLVIAEVAIAVVLLTGAGLLVRSFVSLLQVDPGFSREQVVALQVFLTRSYQKPEQINGFYDQSLEKLKSTPGVEFAAVVGSPPFINLEMDSPFTVVGRPAPPTGSEPTAFYSQVSSEYLDVLKVPLKHGRFITKFDTSNSPNVVVINESMARRFFPDESPVGKKLVVMFDGPVNREIVGVIGNVLHNGLNAEARPEMFVPYQQSPTGLMTFVVRTKSEPGSLIAATKGAIRQVNPAQTFARAATMEELVDDSLKQSRFNLLLLGLFAVIALVLATIGIYGSISYSARQRTNEIGVRIALGAQSKDVLRLIIGQGLTMTLIGVGIGLVASFLLTRTIRGLLFGVGATDPLTFAVISLLLVATAVVASWIPARRATKIDPLIALRNE
jgi:putative ABC transport system permease protein